MIAFWNRQPSAKILAKTEKFLLFPSNAEVNFQQGAKMKELKAVTMCSARKRK